MCHLIPKRDAFRSLGAAQGGTRKTVVARQATSSLVCSVVGVRLEHEVADTLLGVPVRDRAQQREAAPLTIAHRRGVRAGGGGDARCAGPCGTKGRPDRMLV